MMTDEKRELTDVDEWMVEVNRGVMNEICELTGVDMWMVDVEGVTDEGVHNALLWQHPQSHKTDR